MLYLIDQQNLLFHILICAALHELGHLLAIFITGIPIDCIRFSAVGAEIQLQQSLTSRTNYAWIMAGGPIFSLLTALLFAACGQSLCAGLSFILGIFNSLPILPLDGGRFLQVLFGERWECLLQILSWAGTILFCLGGCIFWMRSKENFSLFLIGLFLAESQMRNFSCKSQKKAV